MGGDPRNNLSSCATKVGQRLPLKIGLDQPMGLYAGIAPKARSTAKRSLFDTVLPFGHQLNFSEILPELACPQCNGSR
jgi:hypothetical protein